MDLHLYPTSEYSGTKLNQETALNICNSQFVLQFKGVVQSFGSFWVSLVENQIKRYHSYICLWNINL